MNRRSFFPALAAVIAACAAPDIFLPKLEKGKWKRARGMWVPNPAYDTAPYEISFVNHVTYDQIIFQADSAEGYEFLHERLRMENGFTRVLYPPRYEIGKEHLLVEVMPFIEA